MPPQSSDTTSPTDIRRAIYWTLAAFCLALAVRANNGTYDRWGMVWLSLAISSVLAGNFPILWPQKLAATPVLLNSVLGACVTAFVTLWLVPDGAPRAFLLFAGGFLGCGIVGLILVRLTRQLPLKRFFFPAFLVCYAMLGVVTVSGAQHDEQTSGHFTHKVRNDVQIFGLEAARRLSEGKNPYSEHMPNVMGADLPYYPAGATDTNHRLPFGYPYMPLSALFSLPGYWLGDIRYANVFAMLGVAAFLGYSRSGKTSQLAATAFLLFPSSLYVMVMSWTEPVALFFLGATLFCHFRAPKWLFLALGCLVASKQYTLFLLPLLPLLMPEKAKWKLLLWQSLGGAALLTLPMALWDVPGFYRSAVQMQFKQPFRADSLSYFVTVLHGGGPQLSPLIGFAALVGGLWLGFKRAPRSAAGWCAAGALAYLGFFALNKQAFMNYYYWTFALLLSAVAVLLPGGAEPATRQGAKPQLEIR